MTDDRERLTKKIRFDAARRSSLELELVLRKFLDEHLDSLSFEELLSIERLLEIDDFELSKAIFKKKAPPVNIDSDLWKRLLDATYESA